MHIERIEVAGYQHLIGAWDLDRGLTVVTGPNEAGKSTLHEALRVGLFGFTPDERRRRNGVSAKDERAPWSGGPFAMTVMLVDREGRRLQLEWDLANDRLAAHDRDTGKRVLDEQPLQRRAFTSGPQFLGLTREEHDQIGCLLQADLLPVQPNEELRQALQRAVEATASSEGGVQAADDRLAAVLSRLGVHGGHYGPTPTGRKRQLLDRASRLEDELAVAQQGRIDLDTLAAERMAVAARAERCGARLAVARQRTLRHFAEALAADVRAAEEARAALAATEAIGDPALDPDLRGRVAGARDRLAGAVRELEDAQAADRAAAPVREEALAVVRARQADVDALAAWAESDTSHEEVVRDALTVLTSRAAEVAAPQPPSPRDPVLAEFRATASVATPSARPARAGLLATAAAIAAAGIVAGVAVSPMAFALVLVALALALRTRRPRAPAAPLLKGRRIEELTAEAAAEDRRWVVYEVAVEQHGRQIAAQDDDRRAAAATIAEAVGEPNAEPAATELLARPYLDACRRRHLYDAAVVPLAAAQAKARQCGEARETLARAGTRAEQADADLRRLLRQAGIEEDDLAQAVNAFDELAGRDAEAQAARERRAGDSARLEQVLAGRSLESLRADAERAHVALDADVARSGDHSGEDEDEDADALATNRTELLARVADLEARREEREAALGDPADLELQLAGVAAELDDIDCQTRAVRLARAQLRQAAQDAHRRVAPHLNEALRRSLPHITRGRYLEAMVADDLSVSVIEPLGGTVVDVERLSRGTRDQIALIQRLELARLMDPTNGGSPMLLDDCFAHTDLLRLPLALELLAEVAEHRQVVLFTEDPAVVDAAHAALVIELPDPVPPPRLTRALRPEGASPRGTNVSLPLREVAGGCDR